MHISYHILTNSVYVQMYAKLAEISKILSFLALSPHQPHPQLLPLSYTNTQTTIDTYMENIYSDTKSIESLVALNGWYNYLPANVPLLRHSLMRLALRTWKALVISWFMKLSLFRTLATIIRRSNTSSSSAMVATCIRSPRPSSRLPVYRY